MGRIDLRYLILLCVVFLTGCPAKDWIKRDDSYLTVEQYKTITKVVSVNDKLYRVKKGEEINQNKITQLFYNLEQYLNTPKEEQELAFETVKADYDVDKSIFNTLNFSLIALQTPGNNWRALRALERLQNTGMTQDDKDLMNLAQMLGALLKNERRLLANEKMLRTKNDELEEVVSQTNQQVENLNHQINALKTIEQSIHAREVAIDYQE